MSDYLAAQAALRELIDQHQFAGQAVSAVYQTPAGPDGLLDRGLLPIAQIHHLGGTEGYIDRTDREQVVVYAVGSSNARAIAEAIRARLVNDGLPHDLQIGYLDKIAVEVVPAEVPYADPQIASVHATYRITHRPL